MYIYGGYIDMIGSSQEFWKLDFDTKLWTLLDCIQMEVGPGPRHSHSAMTVLDCMYLFGGLREQRDLWRWNSTCHSWSCLNAMSGPSKLVGHSAYSCPYHKSTATMGQSVYNIDISKPLTHKTPCTLSAI
ncbi:uncharacterized protein [Oncorhynchus clarkii lewisi]|uniref:uncharacterized protein n=1 Tax=Oncorhynchus clarkii lewisi TaxID=490388 RepID=UPI0039B8FD11